MAIPLIAGAQLDTGQKRERNEDFYYRSDLDPDAGEDKGALFIVADGVGGNRGGAEASQAACHHLPKHFFNPDLENMVAFERLSESIRLTHLDIRAIAAQDPIMAEMCCTIVILVILDGEALIANLGDARIYRLRDHELTQLTKDHSWVQEQLDAGLITAEEARHHPHINVVTRTLGGSSVQQPDIRPIRVEEGDRYLLCSDGLHGPVEFDDLTAWMDTPVDPEIIAQDMVDHANRNGGPDNISAVVVQAGNFAGMVPADSRPTAISMRPVSTTAQPGGGIGTLWPQLLSGRAFPMIGIMGLAVLALLVWLIFSGSGGNVEEAVATEPIVAIVPSTEESAANSQVELLATSTLAPDATATVIPTAAPTEAPTLPPTTLIPEPTATSMPTLPPTVAPLAPAVEALPLELLDLRCDRDHPFTPSAEIVFKWRGNPSEMLESGQVMQIVVQSADGSGGVFRQVADAGANVLPAPSNGEWQVPRRLSAFGLVPEGELNWWVEFVVGNEIVATSEKGCFQIEPVAVNVNSSFVIRSPAWSKPS
ncbi:MAG: protein phosphatase 2C domain-containing protein [Chloroflexota bacterium]